MLERPRDDQIQPGEQSGEALILPLAAEDVKHLHVSWWAPLGPGEIERYARHFPDLAWRSAGWRDYVIGGLWRGRPDIGLVLQTGSGRYRPQLIQRLLEAYRLRGSRAVVLADGEAENNLSWYLKDDWHLFEEIVVYERPNCTPFAVERDDLKITPYRDEDLDELMVVDHGAFPWLWWNDREDFRHYLSDPNVSCLVGYLGSELVGYASFTVHGAQGHLDRIAVLPELQGRRYGARLLAAAIDAMAYQRAKRVALTTQTTNRRSQKLYEKYGFRRTRRTQRLYGLWLSNPP